MPLIYGEGRKAFMRLQLEVLKKVDDDSIYAWRAEHGQFGLLATWPSTFAHSGNIVQFVLPEDKIPWMPPTMTSLGLEITARYSRDDPHQQKIDLEHEVHSILTSLPTMDATHMVMYCSPCPPRSSPITHKWWPGDHAQALVIRIQRFGATWQRVNCEKLEFTDFHVRRGGQLNAYQLYYFEQQGV